MKPSIGAGNLLSRTVPITRPCPNLTLGKSEVVHDGNNKFVMSCNDEDQKIAIPTRGSAVRNNNVIMEGMISKTLALLMSFSD